MGLCRDTSRYSPSLLRDDEPTLGPPVAALPALGECLAMTGPEPGVEQNAEGIAALMLIFLTETAFPVEMATPPKFKGH